ncbi:hypothetical protein SLA2020_342640 [Shorea laevis]
MYRRFSAEERQWRATWLSEKEASVEDQFLSLGYHHLSGLLDLLKWKTLGHQMDAAAVTTSPLIPSILSGPR